jgi:phosphoglycolate phosphatase
MKPYDIIIWDWNGTLADDLDAARHATNDILQKRGREPITLEQYYSYIDTPISRFYEHLFDLNEVPMTVIGQEFNEFYPKYFEGLHPGAAELLQELHQAGKCQVILSASHRQNVEKDTERFGIRAYFDEIIAAEDLLAESKVERARRWIARQNVPPERMVMVGDTLHDYETARAMGTDCVLAAIGHQSRQDLLTAGVPVAAEFSQLKALLL